MKYFRQNNPFYALGGGYLLYLVYQMIKGLPETSGTAKIATYVACPVFVAFALVLIVGYVLAWRDAQNEIQEEGTDLAEEEKQTDEKKEED